MKTALVTGACGFVGRHVARALAAHGARVVGLGHGVWGDDWRGDGGRPGDWGIERWHAADVDLERLVEYGGAPDMIVHCAGSGSVAYSFGAPRHDFARTVDATLAVLEYVRLYAPGARIAVPSSAAVYGAAAVQPIATDAPLRPLSPYGVHKAIAEQLVQSYGRHFGVASSVVRLFSVYGPGLRKQLLWDACRKLEAGDAVFAGDGHETRDWIHVEDAAQLLILAAERAAPAVPVVNGGSGAGVAVRAVTARLADRLGTGEPSFNGVIRPGDPRDFRADIAGASALGWRPQHDLKAGLDAYADWYSGTAR